MSERELELLDAIAESIMARSGMPYLEQAEAVLGIIKAAGWQMPPKEEK